MARISFEEWKKQNGRNQETGSAVNNNQTISQPVQSGRMSFEEWKANGRPTFTTARRTAGIAQTNPNNNLRVLSRGFNQTPTITQAVDQFSYNARKAVQSGPINVKDWNKQYEGFMKYLDDYGSQMNGTEVAMLRAKLKNTYDQLNPKKVEIPTYSKLGNLTYDTQNLTTQPRQNMPTYNGGNPFANPSAMAVQNSALGRLNNLANEKIANDARLREDAYMRGIGASNNANTDRELQILQNLYKNAQESRYKQTGTLGNYGPNAVETPVYKDLRAAGETYDPTRSNPAAPGKDDGEDFWQKYERIQREHPEFTEDQIYDYIENEPRADYTPVQKSPLADDSIFTRANNAINTELENRSFLREYAPNYLNEDYKQNSQYNNQFGWQGTVPEVGTQAARGPLGGSLNDDEYARMFYESVNGNKAATDYLTKVKDPETGELLEYDYGQQRYMYDGKNKSVLAEALQDDERGMFNYLYATQGADAAMKYYEGLLPALNQRWTAAYNEELQEKMKDPGLAILYNAFTTAAKPITAIASVANQVYDLAKNGKIDANDPKYAMLNGANLVRAATSKAINNDVLSFLYEGAMSTIDNIYGTMLGSKIADVFGIAGNAANKVTEGIVLGLMTTDAAQASVLSNIQSGMDTTSAITNGLMSGAIEFMTEKIGLDNFFNSMWYGKEKWVSLAKQILSEGGEEVVGNTMDDAWGMLYDRLTGLSTSDWRREMNAYILENGLAPEDELTAFNAVFEQHLLDTAKAGLMGGFSGGIMGGFGMGRGAVELNSQIGNIMPANISFSSADFSAPANVRLADIDQVQGLIEEGLSYEPTTKAYKKAAKLQTMLDTGTVTDSQAIDLYKELVKADVTNESHAAPELSSIDRSGETRPQTAFPMQGPSVNVPAATAQKFIPQDLYLSALQNATEQDNTTTGVTGIDSGEAETLISDIFNAGLEGQMTEDVASRARAFLDQGYTDAIYQAGVQARDTNRRTAFGPTFNMPAQEMVQRDQLIEDVASGYDSAGRTSMGEVMRAFNPFKNHAVTDMSTADYVSEISAVYNAAAQNQEIPPAPHLTPQATQAAINAAEMDRIYLDEGITSAEQTEMEAPEEGTAATVKQAEYTPVEKTAEQRDTDYENVLDYAGEVATADGQETFGDVVANNYYDDMDANAYTAGAQAILEQAQQGVPLEDVTLPAQAQKFISPQLKAELYNAVNTQEALGNAVNTQEVTNGTEESGNVPVPGSSGRVNSTDTGIQSEAVAGRTEPVETAGSTVNVRPDVRNAFHLTGQTATAQSLGIETGTETNTVQIVELDDTEENNQLREIATAAHKKLVTFVGNNLSTGAGDARGIIKGDTIYVRADHPRFTPLQIAKHEVMHGELRNDTNHKINSVLNHLRSLFGENFVDNRLIPAYKSRYAASGLSDLRVLEELICDIYGEMNEWNMKDLPGMEEAYNRFLSKGAQITHEIVRNINQTAEAVTEVRNNGPPTEATMEAAKGDTNDAQFSLEFADAIAKRQENFFDNKATNLIYDKKLFQKAVADTNRMVQTMIQHREILPTDKVGKVLVKNGSYDVSVENTTICIRTLAYNQFVDMVQDKIGRPLTQMESFLVSQKMYDIAVDPQCLYCYVSLDRKAYNEFLGRYIDDRDSALKVYEKAGKPAVNKITKTSPLFEEFLHGRKATDNMLARYKSWLNAYNNGEHLLTKADLKTELKRAEIMQTGTPVEIAQMKDILAYAQSASWSKKQMDYVAYNGEILKMGKQTVNNLNKHYGLRFYSFSDYSGAFIVENMQEVMDASLKGLKGLAYTKDVDFARIFADTGMNINISVFAKFNPETEQYEIDPLQSANLEDAIVLRNEKKNVGIVVVATDTEGVRWAMHQDWSDVVIPFHTVRTGKDVADFYNWQIFTGSQNDVVDPAKQNLWDDYVKSTGKNPKKVSKMIYPSEHNNDYDTYMKLINERGLTPRFNEFRFDENGNVDPTYMKLVNETRQSAKDTNPMVPVFDLTAADESFRKFVDKGGYFGGWYNNGVNVDAEAQIVANDVLAGKTAKDVTYGRQDINPEEVQASRKTNRSHQRMSTEADQNSSETLTSKVQEDVAADLKKRVAQLEKKAEYFKGQTQLSALTPGSAAWKNMTPLINEYQAKKILRSVQDFYGSTTDVSAFTKDIQRLVTYLASRSNGNKFEIINEAVYHIAKKIVENTQVIVEDDGSEILKDIRKTTIKVSPRVQHDIADYNKWRTSHFGKMKLSTNKGTDVTEYYNELTERFGEAAFPSDIGTATDQLLYIADFVDNYQPITQNPYSYDMAAVTQDAALTLYNEILNADLLKPTYADKQNSRIEKLQKESAERVQEVRRQARQQREDQIQKIKDHAKDVAARRRARKEEQTARQKLIRLARRLNSMKTTKANRALIDELIGNLDTVAYSLTEGKAANLMELNAWYETQKETNPDFVAHADMVQKQLARLTQQHIADMTVSEILDLTKSLMTLENDIRTQNRLINTQMNEDALQAGIKAIRDIDNARGIDKGLRRTIDNLIVQGTLSPTRFMHRLTGYNDGDPLYQAVAGDDGLAGGQRKMLDYQYRAGKLFEEWLSDRKFTRWFTGTKAEILSYDIVTADGQQRTIQMTPAMRTTLYLAAKDKGWMQHMCGRDTMDGHIAGGGIVLPDIKSYRKGNISDAYDSGTVKVKITKSFLDKLAQDMSEQELKFAEAIHDYFNGMSKNEINAVSELLLGRSIAEVGDYLPISVDKNFLGAEYGSIKYDGTIEGMGNLKERQASKKPVIVRDITDILKQSIESTSKYVGLAIPIRNFNKIMGVTVGHTDENGVYQNFEGSVLESIANKWGKKAQTYIENMVSDLQTPNNSQEDLEKMFAKIRSKYAGAVLTLNASVALKQAASYPTAAAVLGWKPLMQAFQNPGHVDLDFIAKWTPLQWYRTKGFSTTELGDIQNQNNIFANMPKGLNWIQGMDLITTRKLWKAAEYYVRDNNPELYQKGAGERGQSDAFYRAVADIYNKTIEETQPNYTALQRPEYLRSKSGLVRTLMMFKTQPMQNFNVIYDAVGDFQAKRAQYRNNSDSAEAQQAYEESGKRLRRAVTSQIGQLITFAAMTMLWNMFRRKKEKYTDEEGNVSFAKIAESMGKDVGSGVFGMVPFGSEVWSFISSKIFGDKYYGFESVTDSAISDFLNAGSSAWELIGKIIEDDEPFNLTTYKKKLKTVLSSASKIMGVPFDNLYNTVTAGYMRGRDLVDGLFHGNKNLADYWALSWTEDASKDKAEFFDILYNAHMDGKEGEYEEILQLMIDSGEYGSKPEETIADGLQDAFIKHTTHVKGEPDSDAKYRLYDYMYKHQENEGYEKLHEDALFFGFTEDDIEKGIRNSLAAELIGVPSNEFNKDGLYGHLYSIFDTAEYKEKHDTLTANGWTEDEITDGLKKAYGVQLTGIDSSDYKNADLFTYLYDMKQNNSAGYTAATKEMKKIGFTDDNITDGMKKAYGMQVTGVTEEYSTSVLFDYLYNLKKTHVSNYNAELTKMKGVGFTDKNINDGMKDAYGRAVTGLGSDYTSEALYTTVYKNNKSSLSGKVSEMKGFGFSEQSIRDGLKQAYGSSATGIAYQTVKMDDVYDYIYGLYSQNSNRFGTEYQAMLNVGFTEKAIKDGIEARMKAAYGVDNVKKLPHRFAAPDHTLPSYWTYKNDDKDTGPVKESGTVTGSSHVGGYEYDNGELTIYMNGRPYTYHGVPESVFEDFKAAGSKGGFVNDHIKGKYSYN